MARVALLDASTGNITCALIDGKNLATLYADIINHDHGLSGYTGYTTCNMSLVDASGGTTFLISTTTSGPGSSKTAGASDNHRHGVGSLATDVETATAGAGPSDDTITIACATGNVVADLFNTMAPDEMWERFDGHYHSCMGPNVATENLAALRPKNVAAPTYKYFHTASNSSGDDDTWEEITTAGGGHLHGIGNLSLAALSPSGEGGAGSGASLKFAIRAASGNLETDRNCNGIDISDLWTQHFAHTGHSVTGATANAAQSDAQIAGVGSGHYYVEVSTGTYRLAYLRRAAHSHSGAGVIVATPS